MPRRRRGSKAGLSKASAKTAPQKELPSETVVNGVTAKEEEG
jgi:hypothetical protein